MLIQAALNAILSILKVALGWIQLPSVPQEMSSILNTVIYYIAQGITFIEYFLPMQLLRTLTLLVIAMLAAGHVWDLIWFIINKIPMLNIRK